MAAIRGKNTSPEVLIRRALHARGFRFRLHSKHLPGRPDIVLPKYRAVIFVHGCFWHGHDCPQFRWPATRAEFWQTKIEGNRERDRRQHDILIAKDWRVAVVWECGLEGRARRDIGEVIDSLAAWLSSGGQQFLIEGNFRDGQSDAAS